VRGEGRGRNARRMCSGRVLGLSCIVSVGTVVHTLVFMPTEAFVVQFPFENNFHRSREQEQGTMIVTMKMV